MSKRPSGVLSASRDTLNPLLNTTTLKNRLQTIEHFKYINGKEMAHWPHFAMSRFARHLLRYKGNYAIKGFAAYLIYRDYALLTQLKATTYVTMQQEILIGGNAFLHTGVFLGLCAFI